ncbi:hypothetical protein JCM1393_03430 [Clostridium carnis]
MIKKFSHSSTYSKFLFSYVVLLILPILIITSIMSGIIFNILENVISQKDESSLLLSTSHLKNEIKSCHQVTEMLNTIDEVKPFKYSDNVYGAISLINTLSKYKATNSLFENVFISFYGYDYIYSDSGAYKLDSFLKFSSSNEDIQYNLRASFTSLSYPKIIYDKDNNRNYYTIPYIVNSEIVGTVGFILDNKTISNILSINSTAKTMLLIDSIGNFANLNNNTSSNDISPIKLLNDHNSELTEKQHIFKSLGNESLFISKIQPYNLYFISIKSSNILFKELRDVRFLLFISIFITFTLGTLIIYFLLKVNYKPILQLKDISKKMYKDTYNNEGYNEVEYIKSTLNYLNDRNTELEYQFYENIPIRQNFLLNKLINGEVFEETDFSSKCKEINLSIDAAFNIIVTVKSNNKSLSLLSLLEKNNMHIFSSQYEFIVNSDVSGQSIYLIGLSDNTINYKGKYQLSDNTVISFGSVQSKLTLLTKSYIDSRTYLDFDSKDTFNKNVQFLINKYTKQLKELCKYNSSDKINLNFDKIKNLTIDLNNEDLPFSIIRNIYLEIVIVINSLLNNQHLINYTNIELTSLFEIESKEVLHEIIVESLTEILDILKNVDEHSLPKLSVDEIKNCIDYNYTDYSFSLQLVADKFGISLSYLSQFFKEKTGSTVLDYITNLKMNKAKELLLSTSLPLKDVAEQIGYINVSSFIRRFKQVTGMTPGEYKKIPLNNERSPI